MTELEGVMEELRAELDRLNLPDQEFEAVHIAQQIDVLKRARTIIKYYDRFRQRTG